METSPSTTNGGWRAPPFATPRLYANRLAHGLISWEQTNEQLLPVLEEAEVMP